jgi:hypothetical protein
MTTTDDRSERRGGVLGWALFAALVLYTYLIHQGIGPEPGTNRTWYTPTSFLFSAPVISEMFETLPQAFALFTLPALLLAIAVFLTNVSALARGVAVSCVLTTACFVFYGIEADAIWTFFHWRASAVLTLMTLAIGLAASAPFLAGSWLRLGWPARIASYLPVLVVVLAFIRNSTGTDQNLQFAISPWPGVAVFGMEVGALFIGILLVGIALGVGGIATARARTGAAAVRATLVGVALGVCVPGLLLALGDSLGVFPFSVGGGAVVGMAMVTLVAILIGGTVRTKGDAEVLRQRARRLAVGAALVAIPLVSGQALARYDYYVTREVRARELIDALDTYLEREEIYPDELEELVAAGDLIEIPEPSIGFGFLYDDAFRYRSFGTSFILEFPAPRWVECAYTPPYEDEDGGEDENWGVGGYDRPPGDIVTDDVIDVAAGDGADDESGEADPEPEGDSLDEAWSCPEKPPELW